MNTLENNKLIAEFMGREIGYGGEFIINISPKSGFTKMQYHSDWNELMPVVEKIENDGAYRVNISETYCRIRGKYREFECGGGDYTKLSATLESVCEFIKWFNTQK